MTGTYRYYVHFFVRKENPWTEIFTPKIVFEPDQIRIQELACCRVQIAKILVITETLIDFDTDNLRRHILKDHCNFDQSSADRHEIKVNIEDGLRQMIY